MKWFGRILYFIFVIIVIGFIEFVAGGTEGIRVSEYIYNNVTVEALDNPDYDIFEGLGHLNAVSNTYYSKNQIKTLNDETYYDTTNASIDEKYQVKIGMYPHIVIQKNQHYNLYSDGVFILIEDYSDEALYYSLVVTAYNAADTDKEQIILMYDDSDKRFSSNTYLNIYTDVRISNAERGSFRVALIANNHFANQILKDNPNYEFPLDATFEYHIQAIDVYAYYENEADSNNPEKTHVYRMTDGTNFASGSPLVTHTTLNLAPETYNFSKHLNGEQPTPENNPYNLELSYHPADLSPYNSAYWIVYGVYIVILLVIPYFWFFHGKIMKAIKAGKEAKNPNDENKVTQPQIFSDVEPEEDK